MTSKFDKSALEPSEADSTELDLLDTLLGKSEEDPEELPPPPEHDPEEQAEEEEEEDDPSEAGRIPVLTPDDDSLRNWPIPIPDDSYDPFPGGTTDLELPRDAVFGLRIIADLAHANYVGNGSTVSYLHMGTAYPVVRTQFGLLPAPRDKSAFHPLDVLPWHDGAKHIYWTITGLRVYQTKKNNWFYHNLEQRFEQYSGRVVTRGTADPESPYNFRPYPGNRSPDDSNTNTGNDVNPPTTPTSGRSTPVRPSTPNPPKPEERPAPNNHAERVERIREEQEALLEEWMAKQVDKAAMDRASTIRYDVMAKKAEGTIQMLTPDGGLSNPVPFCRLAIDYSPINKERVTPHDLADLGENLSKTMDEMPFVSVIDPEAPDGEIVGNDERYGVKWRECFYRKGYWEYQRDFVIPQPGINSNYYPGPNQSDTHYATLETARYLNSLLETAKVWNVNGSQKYLDTFSYSDSTPVSVRNYQTINAFDAKINRKGAGEFKQTRHKMAGMTRNRNPKGYLDMGLEPGTISIRVPKHNEAVLHFVEVCALLIDMFEGETTTEVDYHLIRTWVYEFAIRCGGVQEKDMTHLGLKLAPAGAYATPLDLFDIRVGDQYDVPKLSARNDKEACVATACLIMTGCIYISTASTPAGQGHHITQMEIKYPGLALQRTFQEHAAKTLKTLSHPMLKILLGATHGFMSKYTCADTIFGYQQADVSRSLVGFKGRNNNVQQNIGRVISMSGLEDEMTVYDYVWDQRAFREMAAIGDALDPIPGDPILAYLGNVVPGNLYVGSRSNARHAHWYFVCMHLFLGNLRSVMNLQIGNDGAIFDSMIAPGIFTGSCLSPQRVFCRWTADGNKMGSSLINAMAQAAKGSRLPTNNTRDPNYTGDDVFSSAALRKSHLDGDPDEAANWFGYNRGQVPSDLINQVLENIVGWIETTKYSSNLSAAFQPGSVAERVRNWLRVNHYETWKELGRRIGDKMESDYSSNLAYTQIQSRGQSTTQGRALGVRGVSVHSENAVSAYLNMVADNGGDIKAVKVPGQQ